MKRTELALIAALAIPWRVNINSGGYYSALSGACRLRRCIGKHSLPPYLAMPPRAG